MKRKIVVVLSLWSAISVSLLAASAPALAQQSPGSDKFEPQVGQAGKDVIWVPTPQSLVERMLQMAQTTPKDFVVDLGAGDGRIAIAAAKKFGAKSMGIEYNPDMVGLGQRLAKEAGVGDRAQIVQGDIFEKDFTSATVITTYLLTDLNLRLRPKLLEMKPGTRIVTHAFRMGDWEPDEVTTVEGRTAHLWIVPAKIDGRWKVSVGGGAKPREFTVDVEQKYQVVSGTVNFGSITTTLRNPVLRGDTLRFTMVDGDGKARDYVGRATAAGMSGDATLVTGGGKQRWTAVRTAKPS